MSWVVKLEDELGERSEWVMLHGVVPSFEDRDFALLRCIDPYGHTIFNHLQMEAFLIEWQRTRAHAKDDSKNKAWERVKGMAETCQKARDLYLKFVGN